jgi:hypothetical protein
MLKCCYGLWGGYYGKRAAGFAAPDTDGDQGANEALIAAPDGDGA